MDAEDTNTYLPPQHKQKARHKVVFCLGNIPNLENLMCRKTFIKQKRHADHVSKMLTITEAYANQICLLLCLF